MKLVHSLKKTCVIALAAVSFGSVALAASPQSTYEEAARNMAAHPQGEYTVKLGIKVPFAGEGNLVNKIDVQEKPFVVKSQTSVHGFPSVGTKIPETQAYAAQDGKKIKVYYQNDKQKWEKKTYDLDDATPLADKLPKAANVLAGVKTVTAAGGNDYQVTFDASRIYDPADQAAWKKQGMSDEQIRVAAKLLQNLQKTGDVTAIVTIDPQSKRISRISLPLTDSLRSLALTLVDEFGRNDTDKAAAQSLIKLSEVSLTVDCTALPQGTVLAVPKNIK